MSTVNQDELKAIKVLKFEGKESEWERWSEKFVALARARGFAGILLGTEQAPNADEDIDRKKSDGSYELTDAERKEKKRLRQANGNAYINLQLSCEDLPYDLVSLAKTEELPDGCARDAWERLTSEYDLTEGEDKITLLTMFQQNQLEDVRTNITVWLTSLAMQVIKLKKLNHVLDEEYQITHILASLPKEYSSVVEQVKIDRRTSSTLITMDEIKKRLKERYLQLKKEHGWSEDEMALNVKSGNNQNKNVKKGNKGKFFKGRCNHCGKYGHKKADCWDLKNKKEKPQENEKKVQKDKSKIRCYKCGQLGHYANECKNDKESSGGGNNETFAMTCFEEEEDNKNENGDDENKFESKNSEDDERKVGPGTPRNTMEPQRTPPTQTNVFTTQVTNEWAMSTIEDNSATPRDLSSVRAWMESSKYGEYERSRNLINAPLAREKSTLKDRCNNDAQRTGENVARAQPNLSHEEDEIQNSNFEHVPSKRPSEDPEEDDRKPAAKRIKKEPEDDAQSVIQDDTKVENVVKPWEDKKDYEAVFRQHIYIGTDGEEHYDVIDMERDAQRAVRRITDHQEIAKQYQKVVRAYKNYMRDHPWMTEGLMQDNCRFGDLLKDEKRKSQLKYELGRLMGEYAVPLPLGNFSMNNKETRRLELWKNRRGMWFDHVEHMEEGPEQNKEWENFWWTVDEDLFTYVMKTKIEELIEEKLNQEFPEEVEIREDPDYDSEEEMTSETEETDDSESQTNNANVNNYLDSANVVTNLETAMKIAEEEDLWIGDSGASSHMMGSEEHVFNKKLTTGSVRTANGAHMKMLCEGDINVDVITKDGDVTSGTLKVKVIPGMKQKLFSFTQAMMNHAGFTMAKRQQLWCEAAQTATMLDNILVQESAKSPPFTQFFGVDAKYAKHLRVFGEMCVVADTDNKVGRTKIDPRGKISLFVGYSTQHAGDVYRLLNPKTSRVIHSRDVKWIGKTWAEFYKIKMIDRASGHVDPDEDLQLEEDEDQDEQEAEIEPEEDEQEVIQVGQSQAEEPTETPVGVASGEPVASRTRSQTTASEPVAARTRQALGTNPEMSAFADVKDDKTLNEWLHEIAFVTSTMSDPDEPQSFQEAWWDPDLISREKWREAIRLEFKKMLDMGVWRHVKRNDRPNDRRLVGCRWVFKVKRNGVYRARLVAKGFSQIPGVDFTDNYSPVVNDVTFRTVVARMIIENMKGKVVDIDNAFLNGDLEHEIYMKIPEGYDEVINPGVDKEDCLILQKAIYGLVQAARQFWKKIVDKMQEGGFKLSEADPCMLYKEDEKGVCIIIIYIDDMLIIGKEEAIDDAIKVLQGHFQVKDPTSLEDYLGVQIVQSDDGKKAWLGQPTIIKSLEKQFGERVAKKKMTVTPGTPGFIGGKVDDISKVDEKTQSMYRSGVGTLLYLTKHSRPDITNPVRELSKSMDGASMAQVTEMYRVINFVLETKTLGLRMVPIFNDGIWKLEALSDSDFANDKDTRYIVYGYIIYFCGVPVAWKSKSMKSVVLSTTEAEYVAVSEVVKEIKFLYQMLRSMEIKVPLPIKVQVDNVGAIWLANNSSVSERTKHVDLRAHFVRDMIKDQVIEINFVKSAENDSDIMTKNQQGQHYMYAKSKLVYTVQEMNDEKDIQDEETGRMLES